MRQPPLELSVDVLAFQCPGALVIAGSDTISIDKLPLAC